ncbi:MAG: hypothetical protein PVG49_17870 [Desulfobacteraceae bacterium]|jgi:non-specific protein-tyrosine kinase
MSKLKKAMEKARAERGAAEKQPLSDARERVAPPTPPREPQGHPNSSTEEVNPAYTKTRSVPVNPDVLKRNKVFAFFQGHPMADSLKILQTQVLGRLEALGGNTIMVTSANRAEGKTLMAVNLAVSMARELNRTVLLVDTNLRNPSILEVMGMEPQRGLSDYLLKEAEIPDLLIHPGIQKLVLLPAGRPLPHSAELLGSPRMDALVREMRERYPERLVLFDTPALLSSADALAFSRFVDGILLVAETEKTRRQEIKRMTELLEGKPVLGTVLNKTRP